MVPQVGREQDVGIGRRRLAGQVRAGAATHRDPAHRAGRVASRPYPPGGARQRRGRRGGELRRVIGSDSSPTRPRPRGPGSGASMRTSYAGSSYGWVARSAASTADRRDRGKHHLHPCLGHHLDPAGTADHRRRTVTGRNVPIPSLIQAQRL